MKRLAILLFVLITGAAAEESALLPTPEAAEIFDRSVQLVEATMITAPGLARAGEPLLENCRQARVNLQAAGNRHPGHVYSLLSGLKGYLTLVDAMPKPFPQPETEASQLTELRSVTERIDAHFQALLGDLHARLRPPDRDNLKRYAEDNVRMGAPQPNRPRVVFLGDSITDAWGLNEYFPDNDFINRGISGQITSQMLGRMKADVIDLKPKAVVILAGTNDIARGVSVETIQNNITMISELAKLHGIQVILSSILPVHDYNKELDPRFHRTPDRPIKTILEMNDWIRAYCERNRHTYLDYYTELVDDNGFLTKELADDGLHPNAAGYRVMAPLAWNAIVKVVPQPAGPRR